MIEREAISKQTINSYLERNIKGYISESYKEELHELTYESLNIEHYITTLLSFNNINIDQVIERMSDEELIELKNHFDFIDNEATNNEIVVSAIELLSSIMVLRFQPFINKRRDTFDAFLSHCSWDAREVLGIKLLLEKEYKRSVYVDWIDDKQANFPRAIQKILDVIKEVFGRESVSDLDNFYRQVQSNEGMDKINDDKFISDLMIKKLSKSKSLFYVQSRHYDHSRWMPYEIGLAESAKKSIYRLPIQYIRARKKYGKRNGFLVRYDSIINENGEFKMNKCRV